MTRDEFLQEVRTNIESTLGEYRFDNYTKQIAAWKIGPNFTRTYDEVYVWSKLLFISTNSCYLLSQNPDDRTSTKALKHSAEVLENLSTISEKYDKEYCLVLASLCYDIAGYQANARCLMLRQEEYQLESTDDRVDLRADNYILRHVRQILLKNVPKARTLIDSEVDQDLGVRIFNHAVGLWYEQALYGVDNESLDAIHSSYRYYLFTGNVAISHLLHLLETRIRLFFHRSLWNLRNEAQEIGESPIWEKYLRLLTLDLYDALGIKDINSRISRFELWTSQIRALEKGLLRSADSYVVQMPTSAGKTFLAEITILDALVRNPGMRCIYIAPFRASTSEKEVELSEHLSKLGYSVSALSGSYEIDDFQNLVLEETDVLIATPEKVDLLLRLDPNFFSNIAAVVVDEGHIVGDVSPRSSLLEFLLIRLKIKSPELRTLFISAVMNTANADEYAVWLTGRGDRVIRSLLHKGSQPMEEWQPTRRLVGSLRWEENKGWLDYQDLITEDEKTHARTGVFVPSIFVAGQYGKGFPKVGNKAEMTVALAMELANDGNSLIFCAQVPHTQQVANAFLRLLAIIDESDLPPPTNFRQDQESESMQVAAEWFGEESHITRCLKRGIGIHFGNLPDALRKATEADYNRGILSVLISTNTIGQGLNLPIKHLIIHSTVISQDLTVQVRDFWNIMGRAGRAGRETEGQVIFVINTYTDSVAYERYRNRDQIEPAVSMFVNVLQSLVEQRITDNEFDAQIRLLSEPYLLSLLIEEALETDTEKLLESILGTSLFNIQAVSRNLDPDRIKNAFRVIINEVKETLSAELLKVFGQTGLSMKSNYAISLFIDANRTEIENFLDHDNYEGLLSLLFDLFSEDVVYESVEGRLSRFKIPIIDYSGIASLWLRGIEIGDLKLAFAAIDDKEANLNILINEGFYYRFTWVISAFLTILVERLSISRETLPDGISNLASFLKFGLNSPTACLAMSLGIRSRRSANLLYEESGYQSGRDFVRWLGSLSFEEIQQLELNQYDQINILNTCLKVSPPRPERNLARFEFVIKGTFFDEQRKRYSREVAVDDVLAYERDLQNEFDPFAIRILSRNQMIGFVPREFAKQIAVESDINGTLFRIVVVDIADLEDYRRIRVVMTPVG